MKTAVILAAGCGSKIWPYQNTRNKCTISIANKPVILWQVEMLRELGVEKIIVVTGYRREQIYHALRDTLEVLFIEQKGGQGTVPALLSAWDQIADFPALVLYGDVLISREDLSKLIRESAEKPAMAAALLNPLQNELPNDWLCAQTQGERITSVLGHPRDQVSHRFCGAFVLRKEFLPYLKHNPGMMSAIQVGMMSPPDAHLEDSIALALENHEDMLAVETERDFVDVDKPWHILEANEKWLRYLSAQITRSQVGKNSKISDNATINGNIIVGENCEIGAGAIVEGNLWLGDRSKIIQGAVVEAMVSIGKDTIVRRYSQIEALSSIGDGCFVGHCAEVSGVMQRRAYAYHYGEYWGVLGEACDLGAATVCGNLRFDDLQTSHFVKGRREIPKSGANAAYLGDFVRTGVNCIIMPGVKVGPYCLLGAGTIIEQDIPDKTRVFVKQELVQKTWGPERYGW